MYEQIQSAVVALASVCDGACKRDHMGFNGGDARFGHYLAGLPANQWNAKKAVQAHKMLRKYTNQLAGMGIDYSALPVPQMTELAPNLAGKIAMNNCQIYINMRYNEEIKEQLKSLVPYQDRSWNNELKMWVLRSTTTVRDALRILTTEHEFEIRGKAQAWINGEDDEVSVPEYQELEIY